MHAAVEIQDQLSVWSSEDAGQVAHSQNDAQNPQGEEEEVKESELLLIELQYSQEQRQAQGRTGLDPELLELTKGGVAAINRQQVQQRTQVESQQMER